VSQANALTLLRDGITAAKAGDKGRTRQLLRQATQLDPHNELAWLWLAGVAESPQDALNCLQRVLAINPDNGRARDGLKTVRLQAAVVQAKAGHKAAARGALREITEEEPENELAWQWLATVAEGPEEAIECLEHALEINPGNDRAREGLRRYQEQLAARRPAWHCPLCTAKAEQEMARCASCKGVLKLIDANAFFTNGSVDAARIQGSLPRLQAAVRSRPDFGSHFHLALALLNLKRFDDALPQLQAAGQHRAPDGFRLHLNNFIRRKTAFDQAAAADKVRQEKVDQRSVLVVDDSPTVRKLVTMTLQGKGYRVLEAADGYEAARRITEGLPHLVLLDITMPGPDGYEVCKIFKCNPDTARIPIVMLSGKDGFFDKIRGRLAGSTAYITKPFKPEQVLQVVDKYCRVK
jgi:twitching motility two-component system response regulator PilG